jgi:PAS domain S-box-containing protein
VAPSQRFAISVGMYAFAAGLLSFMGWVLDVRRLTSWAGGISMQPNTTLAAAAAGAALVLLTRGRRPFAAAFALLAGLIGLATLFEHMSGIDLGIDALLAFGRPWTGTATVAPGRMGPPAAISFLLLGLGLLSALGGARARQTAAALGLATVAIGMLSLIGYIFGADPLYSVAPLTGIALQTSTMTIGVGLGLVAAAPDCQPMRALLEPSGAGLLARRALPFILVLPVVLGVLLLRGETARVFDAGLGTAFLVLGLIIMMSVGLWWSVGAVAGRERALAAINRTLGESEVRFHRLADAMPQIVSVLNADGQVTFVNQQWRNYTGRPEVEPGDIATGVHPDDLPTLLDGWERARTSGQDYADEFRLRSAADGGYRWFLTRVVPIRDARGLIVQWYATSTDIHDRKQAEEQLRQSAKMEAIGRLAGGVAHDFNNQLLAVSGFAVFAARDPGLGPEARHDLQEVVKATERMAGLTRQLLAFSRQQVLQPEMLQLNDAVLEGSSLLQRLIGSHVEMSLDLAAEPTWIRVDRMQLLQVLMNLALNARDAMPGGGRLRIRTGREGAHVLLAVGDTGTGIPPEHLPRIFEPFFTTKELGQGTGLGLATVHGIITQSQGQIRVKSRPGEGSEFTVLFPAVAPPAAMAGVPAGRAGPGARPAHLLVVDDEEAVRAVVSRILEDEGYEVGQARNGREALEWMSRDHAVDAVLTDVIMPELGGRELGERLAVDYPGMPVIWMSGYTRDAAFSDTGPPGSQPFLQKPILPEVLIRTVEGVLAQRLAT